MLTYNIFIIYSEGRKSAYIDLEKHVPYYIAAKFWEVTGKDYLSVGVYLPNETAPVLITSKYLQRFSP